MRKQGFTLLELMMSMSVMLIVSMLGYYVLKASTDSAELAKTKDEVQACLRDTLTALTADVREAYTQRTVNPVPPVAPAGAQAIAVGTGGTSLVFYLPVPTGDANFIRSSSAITIAFQNEDGASGGTVNAVLDPGEDQNHDRVLNRRLIRTQNGQTTALGAANDLSQATFVLLKNQNSRDDNMTSLQVTLEATKMYGPAHKKLCRERLQGVIDLQN